MENKGNIRFPKLVRIDEAMKGVKPRNYNCNFTLEELIDNFRCFAATQLHLYYNEPLLRAFFGGLAGVQPVADFTREGTTSPLGTMKYKSKI